MLYVYFFQLAKMGCTVIFEHCMNVICSVKCSECSSRLEKHYMNAVMIKFCVDIFLFQLRRNSTRPAMGF